MDPGWSEIQLSIKRHRVPAALSRHRVRRDAECASGHRDVREILDERGPGRLPGRGAAPSVADTWSSDRPSPPGRVAAAFGPAIAGPMMS